ncbi:MAG: DNA polymerase III subunit delta' [Prochlorotrichaceae cyanobacterium]
MFTAFEPLLGQPQAVTLLQRAVQQDAIAPAYLFVGPEGVGRRLAARCFLELLCCLPSARQPQPVASIIQSQLRQGNHPDVLWVEPTYQVQNRRIPASQAAAEGVKTKTPPQIRLEQIREISRFLGRSPLSASRNLVVIEQAERMAESAANGLLKTLEEPGQATLILLAPSVDALLPTIVSRCQRIPFYRLPEAIVSQILSSSQVQITNPTLIKMAEGSPGEALGCAHWLETLPEDIAQLADTPPRTPRSALTIAKQIAKELDLEAQVWFLGYLQHAYWDRFRSQPIMQRLETARFQLQRSVNPRLVWEVLLLELC